MKGVPVIIRTLLCIGVMVSWSGFKAYADIDYRAATIPEELIEGANAVVRFEMTEFSVRDEQRATLKRHRVVTVLNREGRDEGRITLFYDTFQSVNRMSATLYDDEGNVIRRIRRRDFDDYSAISGYSLYDDYRVKYGELFHSVYPYTLEIEYEYRFDGYINWPSWYVNETDVSVERTEFILNIPHDMQFRVRTNHIEGEPEILHERRFKTYVWKAENIPPFKREPLGPHTRDQLMAVHVTPLVFEIERTRGDMSTWGTFARWYYELGEGRDRLPESAVREVKELVEGVESTVEIVRLLYRYMQSRTRYVSVQLGIGGWQPFDAEYVHTRGYGDCKALTNYMKSLLKLVGIESFPVLIENRTIPFTIDPAFPQNVFNHVILAVPVNGDTIWLECTSQMIPFGYIGLSNEDRYALLVKPDGGKLVRTPATSYRENYRISHISVRMEGIEGIEAEVQNRYTGSRQAGVRRGLIGKSQRDRELWLKGNIDLPSFRLESIDYSGIEAGFEELELAYTVSVSGYLNRIQNRILFQPNLLSRRSYVPPAVEERITPVVLSSAYTEVDTVDYFLPAGFQPATLFDPVVIETSFARYEARVYSDIPGQLRYIRIFELRKTKLPPEKYNSLRSFYQEVVREDRRQIVIAR